MLASASSWAFPCGSELDFPRLSKSELLFENFDRELLLMIGFSYFPERTMSR